MKYNKIQIIAMKYNVMQYKNNKENPESWYKMKSLKKYNKKHKEIWVDHLSNEVLFGLIVV